MSDWNERDDRELNKLLGYPRKSLRRLTPQERAERLEDAVSRVEKAVAPLPKPKMRTRRKVPTPSQSLNSRYKSDPYYKVSTVNGRHYWFWNGLWREWNVSKYKSQRKFYTAGWLLTARLGRLAKE